MPGSTNFSNVTFLLAFRRHPHKMSIATTPMDTLPTKNAAPPKLRVGFVMHVMQVAGATLPVQPKRGRPLNPSAQLGSPELKMLID